MADAGPAPRETVLPGGLRVVTEAMAGVGTTTLGVHVDVGARWESAAENGLSHLLEHMAFKGTRRRDALAIVEEIESAGGDLNAATAAEHTFYQARVLPEEAGRALDILADILTDSVFDAQELEREKNVVLQEIAAADDNPDDCVFEIFDAVCYPDQPLGRPILGSRENVGAFAAADLSAFLARHYGAGGLIVTAAGALEHEALVETAARLFPAAAARAPGAAGAPPARYVGGEKILRRKVEQACLVFGFEGFGHTDPRHYAGHAFSTALGGGMASRLFQDIREKRGLAYSIYSFNWSFADSGQFGISAGAAPADVGELMDATADVLAAAALDLSEAELARAKAQMKVSLLAARESSPARAEQLARQCAIFGRPLSMAEIVGAIDGLTLAEVRAAGREMLAGAPSFSMVAPRSARAPDVGALAARLRRA